MTEQYKAHLIIRDISGSEVRRIGLRRLDESYVERVMYGILRNLHEDYDIDDSEVDEARKTNDSAR